MEADTQERPTGALTKRDLADQNFGALDPRRVDNVKITASAGGVAFASALEVMEFAKLMAMSDKAVPKDFRANAGMCLAIVMQAVEWRMSPFQVANKSYVVNDRIGFESQLIHAVIEARAPLKERLNCEYVGEGTSRACRVEGKFLDGSVRLYASPMLKDIKVKNSPLWVGDPDQQLWYYSSRAWARKWCPDVLLGVYSKEEIEADPQLGRDEPPLPGLHARLVGSDVNRDEGHREGHVEKMITESQTADSVTPETLVTDKRIGLNAGALKFCAANAIETLAGILQMSEKEIADAKGVSNTTLVNIKKAVAKHGFALRTDPPPVEADSPSQPKASETPPPKNAKEWSIYCAAWIKDGESAEAVRKRWNDERQLRNTCGVTTEEREPVQNFMTTRCKELGE
jgi:predicted secreted protein